MHACKKSLYTFKLCKVYLHLKLSLLIDYSNTSRYSPLLVNHSDYDEVSVEPCKAVVDLNACTEDGRQAQTFDGALSLSRPVGTLFRLLFPITDIHTDEPQTVTKHLMDGEYEKKNDTHGIRLIWKVGPCNSIKDTE